MSIIQMYSIRDNKTSGFSPVFCANYDEEAKRQMITMAANDKTNLYKFPGDFDLYRVGLFDLSTGRVSSCEVPEMLLTGVDAKNANRQDQL